MLSRVKRILKGCSCVGGRARDADGEHEHEHEHNNDNGNGNHEMLQTRRATRTLSWNKNENDKNSESADVNLDVLANSNKNKNKTNGRGSARSNASRPRRTSTYSLIPPTVTRPARAPEGNAHDIVREAQSRQRRSIGTATLLARSKSRIQHMRKGKDAEPAADAGAPKKLDKGKQRATSLEISNDAEHQQNWPLTASEPAGPSGFLEADDEFESLPRGNVGGSHSHSPAGGSGGEGAGPSSLIPPQHDFDFGFAGPSSSAAAAAAAATSSGANAADNIPRHSLKQGPLCSKVHISAPEEDLKRSVAGNVHGGGHLPPLEGQAAVIEDGFQGIVPEIGTADSEGESIVRSPPTIETVRDEDELEPTRSRSIASEEARQQRENASMLKTPMIGALEANGWGSRAASLHGSARGEQADAEAQHDQARQYTPSETSSVPVPAPLYATAHEAPTDPSIGTAITSDDAPAIPPRSASRPVLTYPPKELNARLRNKNSGLGILTGRPLFANKDGHLVPVSPSASPSLSQPGNDTETESSSNRHEECSAAAITHTDATPSGASGPVGSGTNHSSDSFQSFSTQSNGLNTTTSASRSVVYHDARTGLQENSSGYASSGNLGHATEGLEIIHHEVPAGEGGPVADDDTDTIRNGGVSDVAGRSLDATATTMTPNTNANANAGTASRVPSPHLSPPTHAAWPLPPASTGTVPNRSNSSGSKYTNRSLSFSLSRHGSIAGTLRSGRETAKDLLERTLSALDRSRSTRSAPDGVVVGDERGDEGAGRRKRYGYLIVAGGMDGDESKQRHRHSLALPVQGGEHGDGKGQQQGQHRRASWLEGIIGRSPKEVSETSLPQTESGSSSSSSLSKRGSGDQLLKSAHLTTATRHSTDLTRGDDREDWMPSIPGAGVVRSVSAGFASYIAGPFRKGSRRVSWGGRELNDVRKGGAGLGLKAQSQGQGETERRIRGLLDRGTDGGGQLPMGTLPCGGGKEDTTG